MYNDLTQYPVFPQLADYESKGIDLNDPNMYCDSSKEHTMRHPGCMFCQNSAGSNQIILLYCPTNQNIQNQVRGK